LREICYRGWEAWIDGRRAPVERVNHLLRGLAVPAGDHRVEFVFRAHSFRNGASWSFLGVLLLLVGASNRTRRALTKIESRLGGTLRRILTRVWSKSKASIPRALIAVESALTALSKSKFVMVVAGVWFFSLCWFVFC